MSDQAEGPKHGKLREYADQIIQFWPLIAVVWLVVVGTATLYGERFVDQRIDKKFEDFRAADPVILNLTNEVQNLDDRMDSEITNDALARQQIINQLTTIETRLDTLIRIQLERNQGGG